MNYRRVFLSIPFSLDVVSKNSLIPLTFFVLPQQFLYDSITVGTANDIHDDLMTKHCGIMIVMAIDATGDRNLIDQSLTLFSPLVDRYTSPSSYLFCFYQFLLRLSRVHRLQYLSQYPKAEQCRWSIWVLCEIDHGVNRQGRIATYGLMFSMRRRRAIGRDGVAPPSISSRTNGVLPW
jgi:hypothetical protein